MKTSPSFTLSVQHRRHRRAQRGAILPLMLVLMLIFAVTAGIAVKMVETAESTMKRRTEQVEALNMADSGIDLGVAWLKKQSPDTPPDSNTLRTMTNNFFGTNGTFTAPFGLTGSSLTVKLYADVSNTASTQKGYLIESTAVMPLGSTQVVRVYVKQVSFGNYAFFANNNGDGFFDYHNHFEGPYHSNDADGRQTTFLWKPTTTEGPIFTYAGPDAFEVSGDPLWWKDTIGNVAGPSTDADYNIIAAGGRSSIVSGTGYKTDPTTGAFLYDSNGKKIPKIAQIPLPGNDFAQEYYALGLTPPNPATSAPSTRPASNAPNGADITTGGGVWIHGDSTVKLSVDTNGSQVATVVTANSITGLPQTQVITFNNAQGVINASMVTINSVGLTVSTKTITGALNGLIFSDGNITSLSGTIGDNSVNTDGTIASRNRITVATATDGLNAKDITISDNIKYRTSRDLTKSQSIDTNFNTKAGTLGILSRNVVVKDGAPSNIEVDACIFATGTYKAANPSNPKSSTATMTSIGGTIVSSSGIFAYADNSGNIVSGYNEIYHYDTRLADYPPPYFPTTGTKYKILSWQNVSQAVQ